MKKNEKGFLLLEALIVLVVVAFIVAMMAVSYVSVLQKKDEDNAEEGVQHLTAAQVRYKAAYPALGYASDPQWLSSCNAPPTPADQTHACLVSPALTNGIVYHGYTFNTQGTATGFLVTAAPTSAALGRRFFCSGIGANGDYSEHVYAGVGWNTYNGIVTNADQCYGNPNISPVEDTDQGPAGLNGQQGQPGAAGGTSQGAVSAVTNTTTKQTTIYQCTASAGCTTAPGTSNDWTDITSNMAGGSPVINGAIIGMPMPPGSYVNGQSTSSPSFGPFFFAATASTPVGTGAAGVNGSLNTPQCSSCGFLGSGYTQPFHHFAAYIQGGGGCGIYGGSGPQPVPCNTTILLYGSTQPSCSDLQGTPTSTPLATINYSDISQIQPPATIQTPTVPTCLAVYVTGTGSSSGTGSTTTTSESVFWTIY